MTLPEMRRLLKSWGRWWEARETIQGYASTSVTARIIDIERTGIWASSDKHLFSHGSDSIQPPQWVADIDHKVSFLKPSYIAIINRRYVKNRRMLGNQRRLLLLAERDLQGIL